MASIDPNGSKGGSRGEEVDSACETKEAGSGAAADSTLEMIGCAVAFPMAEGGEG